MRLTETPLAGLVIIDIDYFKDDRGSFIEPWHERDFAEAGLSLRFVQEGHSRSGQGVLRGLHYQDRTAPMGKLVRCTLGSIFDVAVDLRVSSPTFGRWFGVELTAENKRQIYVPPGFAHGFQTLAAVVEVQYKQTGFYTPPAEGTIAWNDPEIGIVWPLADPILSARDQQGITLREYARKPAFP
ncbi:MAG: dTDP-4-dehydrorhamnose 3,5-epimerase [Acidobacteria bacterium RIFCSPLOWO2_02_FULL_65_29]|nr:MAG: dTDP-4-dehydrorhamnose 3,5-epimerase [Acidobacteria bacterium RIFCSPLOWO2_02_FULL_65_29]